MNYSKQSFFIERQGNSLHIAEFLPKENIQADILCIHGAIENGRIFYSENGKGLAAFLAKNSCRVWVPDNRGRGKSLPAIKDGNQHHQLDLITDIIDYIKALQNKNRPLFIITHSWGGVLVNSALLRFPEWVDSIAGIVHFGVKKHVNVNSFRKFFIISIIWNILSPMIVSYKKYLPAKNLRMGSDDESYETLLDSVNWVKNYEWIDRHDNFNYAEASKKIQLPESLFFCGKNDFALGEKSDVIDFMRICGFQLDKLIYLSKLDNFALDYDHINMLTAKEAETDHFKLVKKFILDNIKK